MTKIVGLLGLLGFWMLVAGRGEATPVLLRMKNRQVYQQTDEGDGQASGTYIVLMDSSPSQGSMGTLDETSARSRYSQLLQSMKQGSSALDWNDDSSATEPLHVYSSVCNGFSARLSSQEAAGVRQLDGVLGVIPDTKYSLHTTRTPQYLGLNAMIGLWPKSHFGDKMIIGVLDTGVWPERDSFSDVGMGPVPARWKGICQTGKDFQKKNCNKKLIGARYYTAGYENYLMTTTGKPLNETLESRSPRDTAGHGSHTASTAAGSAVPNANLFGAAKGTARGMAPKARIAVYKVCWLGGCFGSDILAAFDQAAKDGVDVVSLSLGSADQAPYFLDPIAIGAFGAMKKGIFVSCSAGNGGPELQTIENFAPWMMTVAASTVDRSFPAKVKLGDGQILPGESLNQLGGRRSAKLITGAAAAMSNLTIPAHAPSCFPGALDPTLVKGKIVVCTQGIILPVEKSFAVADAGGAGMILTNTPAYGETVDPQAHFLPASNVGAKAATTILAYMNGTLNPVAKFQFKSAQYNVKPAPMMAYFSSRGPSSVTPQVLKPDITGPGVNILAAWTDRIGPTDLDFDTRRVDFSIISGTSMSCPHISGLAALLKASHPEWSPATIKSAMMTSATTLDNTRGTITDEADQNADGTSRPGDPLLFGSGHVRPEKALDPGLVYDLGPQDYVNFLCALNYSLEDIQKIYGDSTFRCPRKTVRAEDMNYPSFSAVFKQPPSQDPISMNLTRTVTNVGNKAYGCTTYKAKIVTPSGITVSVYPNILRFCAKNEKKKFVLQVTTVNAPDDSLKGFSLIYFAFLQWTDGRHVVHSPIAVTVSK